MLNAKSGDRAAKAELVEAFQPLIATVARTYRGSTAIDRGELMQEGAAGLLSALRRYDPGYGTPFWAYAAWWVRQAMQQLVAELARPIVLSDRALRQLARIRDARRARLQTDGTEPSVSELAEATGLTSDQVDHLIAAERAPRGLEEPLGSDHPGSTFGELLADPVAEDEYERVLDRPELDGLHDMIELLSEREQLVLRARYGLDGREQTLREIGGRLGLSAERVRQVEEHALGELRTAVKSAA